MRHLMLVYIELLSDFTNKVSRSMAARVIRANISLCFLRRRPTRRALPTRRRFRAVCLDRTTDAGPLMPLA
jgi:hypothetical protein